MYLITKDEINSIAFTTAINPNIIKDADIMQVENYILKLTNQTIYDGMKNNTPDYAELLNDYVKPYMAYAIKVLTLNNTLADTGLTGDEIYSIKQGIRSAVFNKNHHFSYLSNYLFSNYGIPRKSISGFIIS